MAVAAWAGPALAECLLATLTARYQAELAAAAQALG
jgi:hypothetical protein